MKKIENPYVNQRKSRTFARCKNPAGPQQVADMNLHGLERTTSLLILANNHFIPTGDSTGCRKGSGRREQVRMVYLEFDNNDDQRKYFEASVGGSAGYGQAGHSRP